MVTDRFSNMVRVLRFFGRYPAMDIRPLLPEFEKVNLCLHCLHSLGDPLVFSVTATNGPHGLTPRNLTLTLNLTVSLNLTLTFSYLMINVCMYVLRIDVHNVIPPHLEEANASLHVWGIRDNPLCACGSKQTMSHIFNECPLMKFQGGFNAFHSANKDSVTWLCKFSICWKIE